MLHHVGTRQLETERLILRRHEMADAQDMFDNWVTDPAVSRFWPWSPHRHIGETRALLATWIAEYDAPDHYHWIIASKRASQAIGYIYLADVNDQDDSASVHYALSRKYWNQGIMTEACAAVLGFAFAVLRANRVHSNHHTANPASGRVLQKCGMRHIRTGYLRVPEHERLSGDRDFYEITAAEWHPR